MPSKRYQLFKKTKSFNYKFLGSSSGMNGNMAIKNAKMRGTPISNKCIIIAIPTSVFMKYQLNPKTSTRRFKVRGVKGISSKVTNWSRPK